MNHEIRGADAIAAFFAREIAEPYVARPLEYLMQMISLYYSLGSGRFRF